MHRLMAKALDEALDAIQQIQADARSSANNTRPRWPMIILRSPTGWTRPKIVDGLQIEGTSRAHQVPLLVDAQHPAHVQLLEQWLKSYRADELFDANGTLRPDLRNLAPDGCRRMGANLHANGGGLLRDLRLPDFRSHGISVPAPGAVAAQDTLVLGGFLRAVTQLNQSPRNFRISAPDETVSNFLGAVFEVTNRQWEGPVIATDEFLATDGGVLDAMLSEHQCQVGSRAIC